MKVSPDEDNETQIRGICDAVWESGIDGGMFAVKAGNRFYNMIMSAKVKVLNQ